MDQIVNESNHHIDMEAIAHKCVMFEDEIYRFYRPVWVRDSEGTLALLCENVEQNMLYEGEGIYHVNSSRSGANIYELYESLNENWTETIMRGWFNFGMWVINVSSSDVYKSHQHFTPVGTHLNSYFLANVGGTSWKCGGTAAGDPIRGTVFVQVIGCVTGLDEDSSLAVTFGTALAEYELQGGAFESGVWSVQVPLEIRTLVNHYFKGVALENTQSEANALAYAAFLARIHGRGEMNLNKFAIMYRYCDIIQVPAINGTSWTEQYEFASSEIRVTATIREWGVVLAACWVVAVWFGSVLVSWIAEQREMPNNLFGEAQILRRWAEENESEEVAEAGGKDAFLWVERGEKNGHITATLRRRSARQDSEEQSEGGTSTDASSWT
ncbi:hypothetical protein FGB62_258g01 [Gracilaria domingensis]|nr:hypothetical protein FGB62_258g01 [Gracilaria domingensis]